MVVTNGLLNNTMRSATDDTIVYPIVKARNSNMPCVVAPTGVSKGPRERYVSFALRTPLPPQ